jgi:hypothetical protein
MIQEKVSNIATIDVNSSIIWVSTRFAICKEVITKRQNPSRVADVFRMCWEVLFAILQK